MGILDALRAATIGRAGNSVVVSPGATTTVGPDAEPRPAKDFGQFLDKTIEAGGAMGQHAAYMKMRLDSQVQDRTLVNSEILALAMAGGGGRTATAVGGVVGINDYGVKGRRQYAAERRRLMDLYVIVLNNGDIRTATIHLRNEIFRRGLDWEPAFEYKCDECNEEYSTTEAKQLKGRCDCDPEAPEGHGPPLRKPNRKELDRIKPYMERANYFGQSLEAIWRMGEDDINTVDDAFIYFRKEYEVSEELYYRSQADPFDDKFAPTQEVKQVFRLDPTLVEFDLDARGVPGMLHHVCVFHRDVLLNVPIDEGWDLEWRGRCETCGLRTYPVYFKYAEQQAGSFGARKPDVLYLLEDEVIHWSRYSPTETYGFPPVLSIYEKALTLIGMDRYLYDYFYERRVPQGVITVTTDDPVGMEATKADTEAKMQRDPHHIPWITIASKTGQGKMEFVRFAYSLDELDYLPVRDEIRERVAGLYGVSQIWMQDSEGIGGLNSESQQLTVMSRVVEGAQRSYHTDVSPKTERAFKINDWHLRIKTPEETNELAELQIFSTKVGIATQMAGMGFGIEFDSEEQEFSFSGKVPSREEQEATQRNAANPFGGGGFGAGGMPGMPQPGTPPGGGAQPFGGGQQSQSSPRLTPKVAEAPKPPKPQLTAPRS